ncbi:hypothetical protein [Tsukamurella paurometabola]|uniref:hypothetical protein n=1 Tax=Tsukamurella paurometabola TaxID=2061 RepID=UPI0024B58BD4|nr:hypothetical protein [Tsukamurella paurometabola]
MPLPVALEEFPGSGRSSSAEGRTANQYTRPSRSGTYPNRSPRPKLSPLSGSSTGVSVMPRHAP